MQDYLQHQCLQQRKQRKQRLLQMPKFLKSARYIEPEEWNQKELFAYLFDTGNEMTQYVTTGGLHYYNDNYKEKDHWIKVTLKDSGLFYVMTASDDGSIQIYDQSKKNRIETLTADEKIEYMIKAKAGDVFYIKLPKKLWKKEDMMCICCPLLTRSTLWGLIL